MTSTGFFLSQQQQQQQQQQRQKTPYYLQNDNDNSTPVIISTSRRMLLDMIQEHHSSFVMEYRDRPNTLIRTLVGLHELGANDEQLAQVYNQLYPELMPLKRNYIVINQNNWQEYLGYSGYYGDYLAFFDNQLEQLGMDQLLERYFYLSPLQYSLGSQLQPLVHLAFGIEQHLPLVVTQGLAYLASTFLDASELCEESLTSEEQQGQQPNVTSAATNDELLFDLVGADQRFGGKIDGRNTFHSSIKVLLKSKDDLLKTYMAVWHKNTPQQQQQSLVDQLVVMATRLITYSNHINQGQIELDWFLGGGQLLSSALAIQTLIKHCPSNPSVVSSLVNLQFLATLCTYIVQGRPSRAHYEITPPSSPQRLDWADCVSTIVQSGDQKAILTMHSLKRASECIDDNDLYINTANFLATFVQDGIWIKGGIGWW